MAQTESNDYANILDKFAKIIGSKHVLTDAAEMRPFLTDWRGLYQGSAFAIVKPGNTQEVSEIVRICASENIGIVPQGGNTGLVGGSIPFETGNEIVLSLKRLNQVREVDPLSDTMTVDAGVTLKSVQEAAESVDRLFPLSLASEGSCTIGGNLATNAGGTAVLAYGNARDLVLGLEVVLADGRIWNGLGKLRKDNTGYDLRNIFIGSEGTLGIITAVVLKLFPAPKSRSTAICGLTSPENALALFTMAKMRSGSALTTFELMPRLGVEMVVQHMPNNRDPLETPHNWYVLLELSSAGGANLDSACEELLSEAFEQELVSDAVIASSLDQRDDFWRLRESLSDAQGFEGGSIKHDISVPLASVPQLISDVNRDVELLIPGIRPVPFGHLGDGNLHFNMTQPIGADKSAFLARWDDVNEIVHGYTLKANGSISAEHGIGRLKRGMLEKVKDPVAYDIMRALKSTFDPKNILNPGKVVSPKLV
jgi:FAD/FMN-containing dehydrogenase